MKRYRESVMSSAAFSCHTFAVSDTSGMLQNSFQTDECRLTHSPQSSDTSYPKIETLTRTHAYSMGNSRLESAPLGVTSLACFGIDYLVLITHCKLQISFVVIKRAHNKKKFKNKTLNFRTCTISK